MLSRRRLAAELKDTEDLLLLAYGRFARQHRSMSFYFLLTRANIEDS